MIDKNSTAKEFLEVISLKNPCVEAVNFIASTNEETDSIFKVIDSIEAKDVSGWASWAITFCYKSFAPEIREAIIKRITDTMIAFNLYTSLKEITKEEELLLEGIFKGKLPIAEKELDTGVITRDKI